MSQPKLLPRRQWTLVPGAILFWRPRNGVGPPEFWEITARDGDVIILEKIGGSSRRVAAQRYWLPDPSMRYNISIAARIETSSGQERCAEAPCEPWWGQALAERP